MYNCRIIADDHGVSYKKMKTKHTKKTRILDEMDLLGEALHKSGALIPPNKIHKLKSEKRKGTRKQEDKNFIQKSLEDES